MKKLFAILLSAILVLSLGVTAFAAGEGTITVTSALEGETYSAYRILDLESYNTTTGAYSYKVNSDWTDFAAQDEFKAAFAVDEAGYVTAVDNADLSVFAKAALAYAEKNSIAATASATVAEGETTATITDLALGYYLVDSTVGTVLALTTTQPNAEFEEKNAGPTISKAVQEDSTSEYGESNDADLFQTINYQATITAKAGAYNYVMHDTMSEGLTFDKVTNVTIGGAEVDSTNYTVTTENLDDGCTFEVAFAQDLLDTITKDTTIVVSYTAHLNENAIIAGDGNENTVYLSYGETSKTASDKTVTYTYEFDLIKTDENNNLLDGAEFEVYRVNGDSGTKLSFLTDADGAYYVVPEGTAGATDVVIVEGGKVTVYGLDSDSYYLNETVAPTGYNKLTSTQSFTITAENLNATFEEAKYVSGGVQVVNKTGTVLPETGGIGTTIFTVVGALLILGAGILLIVKKRMQVVAE